MNWKRWLVVLAATSLIVILIAPSVLAEAPTGAGPNDPLSAAGNWLTAAPQSNLWFYFDYAGDKSIVQVDVDDNAAPGVRLAIFTPDQATAFVQDATTQPVGWGTPPGSNSEAAVHDLIWRGGFNFGGRFFAVVQNTNPTPMAFRITISGTNVITAPTPLPTPTLNLPNPFATSVPTGTVQGQLVFQDASGGIIYTVNGDGSNLTRVTYGLDPSWSPDGTQIAFSRWNPPAGLFIVNADGSNEQALFGSDQLLSPQWSPDGGQIIFTQQKGGLQEGKPFCFRGRCISQPPDPHWKLGLLNLTTRVLTEPQCSNHCFSPTWTQDGHTIAYADGTFGILTTDTDPSAGPAVNLFTQNPAVQSPLYSPDGSRIVFQVKQSDHWEINAMQADGSNVTALTHADPLSFQVVNNVAPTWSPDGKQVMFLSDRNGKWEFFVVNADGTGLTQVLKSVTDRVPIRYNFSNERVIDWKR